MKITDAQADMRQAYYGGATGALVSGTVWLVAGMIALFSTEWNSLLFFFFGGMMIFPLSMVLSKLLKRTGQHLKENPLAHTALESTVLLFIGLFIAFVVYRLQPLWFFPIMLLIIGGRYLIFNTLYGMKVYWIFGMVLILAGVGLIVMNQPFWIGAVVGGLIEVVFAGIIFYLEKNLT